jgi:hypothetical protein
MTSGSARSASSCGFIFTPPMSTRYGVVVLAEEIEERFGLQRDLARRRDDQAAHAAAVREALGHRQDERGGLAGAGLREADDVFAGERGRNDRGLNRRRMDEADLSRWSRRPPAKGRGRKTLRRWYRRGAAEWRH